MSLLCACVRENLKGEVHRSERREFARSPISKSWHLSEHLKTGKQINQVHCFWKHAVCVCLSWAQCEILCVLVVAAFQWVLSPFVHRQAIQIFDFAFELSTSSSSSQIETLSMDCRYVHIYIYIYNHLYIYIIYYIYLLYVFTIYMFTIYIFAIYIYYILYLLYSYLLYIYYIYICIYYIYIYYLYLLYIYIFTICIYIYYLYLYADMFPHRCSHLDMLVRACVHDKTRTCTQRRPAPRPCSKPSEA